MSRQHSALDVTISLVEGRGVGLLNAFDPERLKVAGTHHSGYMSHGQLATDHVVVDEVACVHREVVRLIEQSLPNRRSPVFGNQEARLVYPR
eukprot:CAMPEP_0175906592 /NCGR_PEP_ID=MMETSP0108-20121206/5624_1 /TAXON_ID=195067 ORGANISM="Goniomonas pacifica, Strain CCMP1869" /NCGR_SAMPLE_ID=MMETSP0108 /ASSEMBLY_ACC=CAM_ASM_000204 /LENGTH=91 /DNA_ID=CAMNT_0017228545 /DNA_START=141 /DNA_END=417 /DNA_ORIENTATION=-